jgi:hypothetical protein
MRLRISTLIAAKFTPAKNTPYITSDWIEMLWADKL